MKTYDVVVLGLGIMGSAATYSLAKRGVSVLGVDANSPHHTLGSSHGPTRATRETYFEAPEYVPLAQRSNALWRTLEDESGSSLLEANGGIYFAPSGHAMLEGVQKGAAVHNLPLEHLDTKEFAKQLPGFSLPDSWQVLREHGAGMLQAPACLDAFRDLARRGGAEFSFNCKATNWKQAKGGVVIQLDGEDVYAGKVVLALGPWMCDAISELGLPLSHRRIPVTYFETAKPKLYQSTDFSVYFGATPEGVFAGKPHLDRFGTMLVRHDEGENTGPEATNRVVMEDDLNQARDFADLYLPGLNGGIKSTHVCLYTMTPDSHFIIDRHPDLNDLTYATGFSGHGFKFAPVVGEVLADLALDGRSDYPTEFLSAARFG